MLWLKLVPCLGGRRGSGRVGVMEALDENADLAEALRVRAAADEPGTCAGLGLRKGAPAASAKAAARSINFCLSMRHILLRTFFYYHY